MDKRDYYDILGLQRGVAEGEIKRAYRKLAVQFHPDKNPGDQTAEEKFKEATEAYEILKDPQKRAAYDQYGHAAFSQGGGGGGFGGFDISDALRAFMRDFGGGGGGFGDIFDEMLGGGGGGRSRRGGPRKGHDLRITLPLTIEDIAAGVSKKLKIQRLVRCERCDGSGAEPGYTPEKCPTCHGAGEVRRVSRSFFGQFVSVSACPTCNGDGQIVIHKCSECRGEGVVSGVTTISVKIPAGVSAGNYIPVSGAGHIGSHGGPAGDAIVMIEEKPHDIFTRQGDDLICEIPISFSQAALGDQIAVPTLNGDHQLKIPPGAQSGKVFRLKNKGIPHLRGLGKGDQLVRLVVWTPTKLSAEEKVLFKKLSTMSGTQPPKADKSFFDKLRETLGV